MGRIKVLVRGQELRMIEKPLITSGNKNVDYMDVVFDETWNFEDATFYVRFYPTDAEPIDVKLENESCLLPEVLTENPCVFSFKVWCEAGEKTKTSNIEKYVVYYEGSKSTGEGSSGGNYVTRDEFHAHSNKDALDTITQETLDKIGKGLTEEQEADLNANTEARHTHSNKKTLDLFSCFSVDTGFTQDASSDDLKWRGMPIAFEGFTATISGVEEIEKDGAKFLRLSLSQGNLVYNKLPDYIDIPIAGSKDVSENPAPDITLNGSELEFDIPDNSTEFDDIWQAINNISGGIDEIEAMIDESGVLE